MKPTTDHWQIAWREQGKKEFHIVQNPPWGWCADPFLISFDGKILLFAEIFLFRSERNGIIGYCQFNGNGFGDWTVAMDRPWHLSYPNVWTEKGKLYMCPESYQLGEVSIYELIDFPDKWKKAKTLFSNVDYCDTTFFTFNYQKYLFTFERKPGTLDGNGIVYKLDKDNDPIDKQVVATKRDNARCGGNFITQDDKLIRVAQKSVNKYGEGLVFYEVEQVEPEYREHEVRRIDGKDISTIPEAKTEGIHTFNRLSGLEVVDFREERFLLSEYIARKRVRKVFVNKY